MDTPLQDWGILLYNQSRREKREAKQGTKMASPRQDNTLETATPGGSVVTTVIRSDDEIPASGTPRRQKLSLRRNESIKSQETSSSSSNASDSEVEEVASNDSNDRDLWQDSVDPTLIGDHSEGEKDSVVTHTQICGGDAPVEAKVLDTTQDIAATTRLSNKEWSVEAMRIEIPDLLQWIDMNSNYSVAQVGPPKKRKQLVLASAALLPEVNAPEPFVGLNVNPGYEHIQREILEEFVAHRPHQLKVMVGKYNPPPNTTMGAKIGSFKLAGDGFCEGALKYPMAMPDFLSPMQGHFIATVREEDLKRWEEASRSSLVILSNLDAAVEAMVSTYPEHMQRNLYLMRSMFRVVQGLEALTRITVGSLHQAVTHRRDAAINARLNHKTKPLEIREDHLEKLRYAPFVNERFLFDPTLLQEIATEREAITDKRLSAAALSSIASNVYRNQPAVVAKASKRRSVAATTSTPVEASGKKAKTERVAKAVQPVQTVPSGEPASTTPNR